MRVPNAGEDDEDEDEWRWEATGGHRNVAAPAQAKGGHRD